jgi:hypothetical protein
MTHKPEPTLFDAYEDYLAGLNHHTRRMVLAEFCWSFGTLAVLATIVFTLIALVHR